MIKREVVHNKQVKTVYSSQKQERMKIYFDLTNQYNQCMQPCKINPIQHRDQCKAECQKIYDKYTELLKPRYEENKERIDMEVKNSPIFTTRARKDRSGFFFDLMGFTFKQFVGLEQEYKP